MTLTVNRPESSPLFSATLIPSDFLSGVPSGHTLRPLEDGDYDKGYLKLLEQLTVVGEISREQFVQRFKDMQALPLRTVVIQSPDDQIVASGTLLLESKFVRNCGKVGHIEDIVVDASLRGKNIGKLIIQCLTEMAKQQGAYKVILSCSEKNRGFYERCGLIQKELTMAYYVDN
ncbi:acyl-CoA N-acyltransferase [Gaertneriomyces semiglobifer]|nr:acyl-CoA N-acyltransferase [Gaertneriomyces semiglobifer]